MSGPEHEKQLFLTALERPTAAEREAFLREACGEDSGLYQRLQVLIAMHEQSRGPLDQPLSDPALEATRSQAAEIPGTVIGPYKLLQQIGEGGMGVVYMAEQTEPVERRVALKIIKPGMDTRQVIARFEAERQALALMDHPNIARVLDAGTTGRVEGQGSRVESVNTLDPGPSALDPSAGRPYFVMELVKGLPITQYCDEQHLTPRERLELFLPICQAVQHAHQKGVIHRDLKPSNILITRYDDKAVPKIIDFGVAKAVSQRLTEKTMFTQYGQIVGTIEYMSPEQAQFNQLDVDTRSDIYSLGVLLYELLTGETPFDKQRLRTAAFDELLRIIREEEPPRPSTRVSTLAAAEQSTVATARCTAPRELAMSLRHELDWIVMKALEKDRGRRYDTATAFAADVQRYLSDEPVTACPPSTSYRVKKFVRRNKGPVLATAIVLLTLLGGIVGTTVGLVRAKAAWEAATERAEGERQAKERAEANFALANEAVETYLGTVAYVPELMRADFNPLRMRLLESALPFFQKIAAQKSDDPEVEAGRGWANLRLAFLRTELGQYEAAIQDAEAARLIFSRLTADAPLAPAYRRALATSHAYLGTALRRMTSLREAEAAHRRAVAIQEQLVADFPAEPEYRLELTNSLNEIAILLKWRRQHEEAQPVYRRVLAIREQLTADFPQEPKYRHALAHSHNNMGTFLQEHGNFPEAEAAFRRAVDIQEQLVADFPEEPEYRRDLAKHHMNLGNLLNDEAAHRRALTLLERLAADFPTVVEYRLQLAAAHHDRGSLLELLDRPGEAEAAYRLAVEIRERLVAELPAVPEYRQELAQTHNNLGNLLKNLGKYDEADTALRRSLELREKLAGDFPDVAEYALDLGASYCNVGHLVRDSGEPDAALDWFQQAIARLEPLVTLEPLLVGARRFLRNSHWGRAATLDALGRHAEALPDWERALELDDGTAREELRSNLAASRLRTFQKDKAAAGCLAAAADYESLSRTDVAGLYDAACFRAVCAAVILEDPNTPAAAAARLAGEQADLAMDWLEKAVAAGLTNVEWLQQDSDLDALRAREDFKRLLAELEARQNQAADADV